MQLFGWTLPSWSKTADLVIFVISLVAVYKAFGYHNFLILLSGVSSVPEELIEAAKLEKTPKRTIFQQIVVPLTVFLRHLHFDYVHGAGDPVCLYADQGADTGQVE